MANKITPTKIQKYIDEETFVQVDRALTTPSQNPFYRLEIQSPPLPIGVDRAKVTIKTAFGEDTFTHIYENTCLVPAPNGDSNGEEDDDEDVRNAYEDCLDLATDLFCEPKEFLNAGSLESKIQITLGTMKGDKIAPGALVTSLVTLKGSGYYSLQIYAILEEDDQQITLFEQAGGIETLNIEYVIESQITALNTHKEIEIRFETRDTENKTDFTKFYRYEIYKQQISEVIPQPILRQLQADNDLSDENKELYVTSNSVIDINITEENIGDSSISDPIRSIDKNFWIKKSPEIDVLVHNENVAEGILETSNPINTEYHTMYYYADQMSDKYKQYSILNTLDLAYINEKPYTIKELQNRYAIAGSMILDVKKEYNFYDREYENYLSARIDSPMEHILPNMYYILLVDKLYKTRKTTTLDDDVQLDPDIVGHVTLEYKELAEKYEELRTLLKQNPEGIRAGIRVLGTTRGGAATGTLVINEEKKERLEQEIYSSISNRDWYQYWLNKDNKDKFVDISNSNATTQTQSVPSVGTATITRAQSVPSVGTVTITQAALISGIAQTTREKTADFVERTKNILIPYSGLEDIETLSKQNQLFPLFVDINFDTDKRYSFSLELSQNQYGEQFFINCANRFIEEEGLLELDLIKQQGEGNTAQIFTSKNRYIDITNLAGIASNVSQDKFVYLGDYRRFLDLPEQQRDSTNDIGLQKINKKIFQQILPYRSRRYTDILAGKKCYKETLFYRIEKKKKGSNTILQNIWIAKDPRKQHIRYVDTQVIYEKDYVYTIYSYDVVIGNRYQKGLSQVDPMSGQLPNMSDSAAVRAAVAQSLDNNKNFINEIKLFLVENVYDQFEAKVTDKPPIHPQVQIKPYIGVDNRITFLFNKASATVKQEEIIIKEEDRLVFDVARRAQNLNDDELIEFSGDDLVKKYQIFRTTTPPKNYRSFVDADMKEQSTLLDETNPNLRTNASSFEDKIKPNTKYYYTFRCVDIHDQISNPTIVYQVEIVNENGTIFPIIEEYKFPEREDYQETKNIRRFLMLRTDVLQEYLSVLSEGVGNINDFENNGQNLVQLGIKEKSPYGKLYKMRLVSKNTKKVYDINFKFGKTIEKIE